jgi:hypothetical protein
MLRNPIQAPEKKIPISTLLLLSLAYWISHWILWNWWWLLSHTSIGARL